MLFSTQVFDPDEVSGVAAAVVVALGRISAARTASISSCAGAGGGVGAGAVVAGVLAASGVPSGVFSSLSVDIVDCSKASSG